MTDFYLKKSIIYRRPLICVWFNRPTDLAFPMALHCPYFRPTISLRKTLLYCFSYLRIVIVVIHKLPPLRCVHIVLHMPSAHYLRHSQRAAMGTPVFDYAGFIPDSDSLLKAVVAYYPYRFRLHFSYCHLKIVLLSSRDKVMSKFDLLAIRSGTPVSKTVTSGYLGIQSSSGQRLCIPV